MDLKIPTDVIDPGGPSKPKLPNSISQSNLRKTEGLKRLLRRSIMQHKVVGFPHTLGHMTSYDIRLYDVSDQPQAVRHLVDKVLLDMDMCKDLEELQVINFCRTVQRLYALKTAGDGNCLLHAVSMAMWGFHDKAMLLRRLVYISLVEDGGTNSFYTRWEREHRRLHEEVPHGVKLTPQQWSQEWKLIVQAAEDKKNETERGQLPFESLEEIHIFVLANVIQRPIIVLSENVVKSLRGSILGPNNFGGIYLPLLWDAAKCTKTPLILGYHMGHFTPLVHKASRPTTPSSIVGEYVVPLVTKDLEPIHIHFLSDAEESLANLLLQEYLKVTEINWTKSDGLHLLLCARLHHNKIPDQYDLIMEFMSRVIPGHGGTDIPTGGAPARSHIAGAKVRDTEEVPGLYLGNQKQTAPGTGLAIAGIGGTLGSIGGAIGTAVGTALGAAIGGGGGAISGAISGGSSAIGGASVNDEQVQHEPFQREAIEHEVNKHELDIRESVHQGPSEGHVRQSSSSQRGKSAVERESGSEKSTNQQGNDNNFMISYDNSGRGESAAESKRIYPAGSGQELPQDQPHSAPRSRPCRNHDCEFFGRTEYRGYCYQCFLQTTRDPVASSVHQRESQYELSVMDSQCAYQVHCTNMASRHTYPYCHEHRDGVQQSIPGRQHNAPIESHSPQSPRRHYPSLGQGNHGNASPMRSSGGRELSPEPRHMYNQSITEYQCHHYGCKNAASTKHFPYCHEHQHSRHAGPPLGQSTADLQRRQQLRPSQQTHPSQSSRPSQPSRPTQRRPQDGGWMDGYADLVYPSNLSITPDKCLQLSCSNRASKNTFPYCHEHKHQLSGEDEPPPSLYTMARAEPYQPTQAQTRTQEHRQTHRPTRTQEHGQTHRQTQNQEHGQTRTQEHSQTQIQEHGQTRSQTRTQEHRKTQPQPCHQPEPETSPEPLIYQCTYPGCRLYGSYRTHPYCHQHHVQRSSEVRQRSSEVRQMSHTPGQRSGSGSQGPTPRDPYHPESPHEVLSGQQGLEVKGSGSLPQVVVMETKYELEPADKCHSLDSIKVGKSQICPESGCTLYGPLATDYYCPHHYNIRPISMQENAEPGCGQLTDPAASTKYENLTCAKPGCSQPANIKYEGLCSNCFLLEGFTDELIPVASPDHIPEEVIMEKPDPTQAAQSETAASKAEKTVDRSEKTIDRTEKTIDKEEMTIDRTEKTIDKTEKTINKDEKTIDRTEKTIDKDEKTIDKTEKTIDKNEKTIDTIDKDETTINKPKMTIKKPEMTINKPEMTMNEHETSTTGPKPTNTETKVPESEKITPNPKATKSKKTTSKFEQTSKSSSEPMNKPVSGHMSGTRPKTASHETQPPDTVRHTEGQTTCVFCENYVKSSNDLCEICLDILRKTRGQETTSEAYQAEPPSRSKVEKKTSKPTKEATQDGVLEPSIPLNELSTSDRPSSVLPCVSEGCTLLGSADTNYYCLSCYKENMVSEGHIRPKLKLKMKKTGDKSSDSKRQLYNGGIPCCGGHDLPDSPGAHTPSCPFNKHQTNNHVTSKVVKTYKPAVNSPSGMRNDKKTRTARSSSNVYNAISNVTGPNEPTGLPKPINPTKPIGPSKPTDPTKPNGPSKPIGPSELTDPSGDTTGLQTLSGIENSIRASVRKCKNKPCNNFGNQAKKGFCNGCYSRIR